MSNYGDMKSRIADEIADSTLTSQIILAIQTAIKFYERREFYFNTKTLSFNTVSNQEYYGASDQADIPLLVNIKSMTVAVDGYKQAITPAAYTDIDFNQTGFVVGPPSVRAYFAEQIRMYPIPDRAYQCTMSYTYRLPALTDDADENAWTDDAEELIRQRAKKIIATDVLRDVDMSQAASVMETDALNQLIRENKNRRSNGMLRTELAMNLTHYNIYTDN